MQFQFGNMWSVYARKSDLFLACGHSEVLANNCLSASCGILAEAVEKLQGVERIFGRYIGLSPKKYLLIRAKSWEKGRKFGLYQVGMHDGEVDTEVLYQSLRILRKFAEQNPDLRIDMESPTVYGLKLDQATHMLEPLPDNVYVWIPQDEDDEDDDIEDEEIEELRPTRQLTREEAAAARVRADLFEDLCKMYEDARSEEETRYFDLESVRSAIPSRLFAEDVEKNYYRSLDVFEVYATRNEEVLFRFYCPAAKAEFPAEVGQMLQIGDYLVSFHHPGFVTGEKLTRPFATTVEITERHIDGAVPEQGDEMPDTPPWDSHPANWRKLDDAVEDVPPPTTPTPAPEPQPKPKRVRRKSDKSNTALESVAG